MSSHGGTIEVGFVADARKTHHTHPAMTGDDHFRNCGHAYRIRACHPQESQICGSLKGRSAQATVNTLLKWHIFLSCGFACGIHQIAVIHLTHIREARTNLIEVWSEQRIV